MISVNQASSYFAELSTEITVCLTAPYARTLMSAGSTLRFSAIAVSSNPVGIFIPPPRFTTRLSENVREETAKTRWHAV